MPRWSNIDPIFRWWWRKSKQRWCRSFASHPPPRWLLPPCCSSSPRQSWERCRSRRRSGVHVGFSSLLGLPALTRCQQQALGLSGIINKWRGSCVCVWTVGWTDKWNPDVMSLSVQHVRDRVEQRNRFSEPKLSCIKDTSGIFQMRCRVKA